jgi:transposase InsO family protein
MGASAILIPFGILEVSLGQQNLDQLWLAFGTSRETSDFIADALEQWWDERGPRYVGVKRLQIELDNGPEINSSRTQFMKRLVEFADRTGLEIELVYLPPYHSKYNPIERCWGVLENHRNGTLLSSVELVLNWASTMMWRSVQPIVHLVESVYERGVRLTKAAFRPIAERLQRSDHLPKWSVIIKPQ